MRPLAVILVAVAGCATASGDGSGDNPAGGDAAATPDAIKPDAFVPADGPAPGIDAPPPPVDAPPPPVDAHLPPDAGPPPVQDGESCAGAIDLTAMATAPGGARVDGTTRNHTDDAHPAATCTGYATVGPDLIYKVTAAAGQSISATASSGFLGWDLAVYITTDCAATTCVAGADRGGLIMNETAVGTAPAAGTYYIVVDSWNAGVAGNFTLDLTVH